MREKQIEIVTKIIAKKAADYRDPNVPFMTTAKKSATAIYHEFCKLESEGKWQVYKCKSGRSFINCSVCDSVLDCEYHNINESDFNYCPYCGTRMKGGGE